MNTSRAPRPELLWLLAAGALLLARRGAAARALGRSAVAVALTAAALLVVAVTARLDRVVEIEEPQVARQGGRTEPPEGTYSRFMRPNGWRIGDGEGVTVPLNLPAGARLDVEGWIEGAARHGAALAVRWDDAEPVDLPIAGPGGRAALPPPPGPGRHALQLTLRAPAGGEVVLDRVVVRR